MNNAPGRTLQQKFSTTPEKPAGKFRFLPGGKFKNKYHFNLNLSCNCCLVDSEKWDR
ncbi:MAG: hypothetical protein K0B11_12925 [Mariniphaga sp.]|nr:hypothetical protein [Mariniphaga sp.]